VIYNKGVEVTSLAVLLLIFALADIGMATSNTSMTSYEDLLRQQTYLIGSFENLLKNTTLDSENSYKFLDSFDDLADRQQEGLYSFEDLVSYNWSDLKTADKINMTNSYEDLLRRQAVILTSNEALLKRDFCKLSPEDKEELLGRFEGRLHSEVVLVKKFEDWLHYQQMIENESPTLKDTWLSFLSSFEDLIRRQSNLLDSFEMLMKIDCSETYMTVEKSTDVTTDNVSPSTLVTFTYTITAKTNEIKNIEVIDSVWGLVGYIDNVSPGFSKPLTLQRYLNCADCNYCQCKVCNFATACGEVITGNGNFTVCDVSNEVCLIVNEDFPLQQDVNIYPGKKLTETAEVPAAEVEVPAVQTMTETSGKVIVEVTQAPVEQPKATGCSVCGKK
jgi:hypothetical protein